LKEKAVMIGVCFAKIEMHKSHDINARKVRVIQNVAVDEVEVGRIKGELGVEFFARVSKVSELMD
jgi:hypothetical protein